jgi:cytochrome c oxidase assembly protein subunit 15
VIAALAGVGLVLTLVVTTASAYIRLQQTESECAQSRACRETRIAAPFSADVSDARSLHRVAASSTGALVLAIAVLAWRRRAAAPLRIAATLALLVTLFLAAIGRQATPLDATVVAGNVSGGMALAALLAWLAVRARAGEAERTSRQAWIALTAALLASTLALGGMPGAHTLHALAGIAAAVALVAHGGVE